MTPTSAATGRGEDVAGCVFTSVSGISHRDRNLTDTVDPGTLAVHLLGDVLTKVPDLFSKSEQQY